MVENTPWIIDDGYIFDADDSIIGKTYQKSHAKHIVKCVNMHDELVETVKSLLNAGFFGSNGANDKALETLKKAGAL